MVYEKNSCSLLYSRMEGNKILVFQILKILLFSLYIICTIHYITENIFFIFPIVVFTIHSLYNVPTLHNWGIYRIQNTALFSILIYWQILIVFCILSQPNYLETHALTVRNRSYSSAAPLYCMYLGRVETYIWLTMIYTLW